MCYVRASTVRIRKPKLDSDRGLKMAQRSIAVRALVLFLSLLTIVVTAPFSLAQTIAGLPLGAIVTPGRVTIGNTVAPTGTTIFAGDQVVSSEPALINLNSGSRIEMTKAAATFTRQGKTLLVQANQGLLRFSFIKGENVQIMAGQYTITPVNDSAHVGELGLNRNGQVVMTVTEGVFAVLNTVTGSRTEAYPNNPMVAMDQGGKGSITKNGKTLTDSSKSYKTDELKGKCIVMVGEAYPILGNTATVITIKGSWKAVTGSYDYKVVDCTKDALVAAGATAASAGAAAVAVGVGTATVAAAGLSTAAIAGIVVGGTAAAVGLGVGIHEAVKSSSSR